MKHKELDSNSKFGQTKLFSELYSLRIRIRGRELLHESFFQQKETLENKLNINSFNAERDAINVWLKYLQLSTQLYAILSSFSTRPKIWLKDDRGAQKKNPSKEYGHD